MTLDVRQIKVALKGLRRLNRIGPEDELDIDETIDHTAKNVGEIELVWRRRRKNAVKLLLLMDTGGTMDPYIRIAVNYSPRLIPAPISKTSSITISTTASITRSIKIW